MTDDTIPLFSFPAIQGKKVTAAFDGGRLSSDGGVMLLSMAERHLGVAERLARCIPDRRDPSRIAHTIADMIRARVFAICAGMRTPTISMSCAPTRISSLPAGDCLTAAALSSRPTVSRLETAPALKDVIWLT